MAQDREFYRSCSEASLVLLAKEGDQRAFDALVRGRQSALRNMMRRFCGDATLGDDLAQIVFLQVYEKLKMLKNPGAFGAWLKRIGVSVWLQHVRKNEVLRNADSLEEEIPIATVAGLKQDLNAALSILPAMARTCIVLSYQEGHTHAEIADLTKLELGTVKSHISRGSKKMREFLSAYGDDSSREDAK